MYRGKVASIILRKNEAENVEYLDLELEILTDDDVQDVVEVRRLSFPVGSSEEHIKEELKKYMKTYNQDAKMAVENKAQEQKTIEKEEEVSKIKDSLEGEVI